MGNNQVRAGGTKLAAAKKKIHHVWIGSRVEQKELDYANIWGRVNGASYEENGASREGYRSTLWVDPNALLVNDTKKEILIWAEWRALKDMGVTDVASFNAKLANYEARRTFAQKKLHWASRKRYELAAAIAALPSYVLSVPVVSNVYGDRFALIYPLVREAGVSERFLTLVDDAGNAGMLDLEKHQAYASVRCDDSVQYVVNGEVQFSMPGHQPLEFVTITKAGEVERVMMWTVTNDIRADISYVDDKIKSAVVRMLPDALRTLVMHSDRAGLECLRPWLSQLPVTLPVFLVDGEGAVAVGVRDADRDGAFMLTHYANHKNAVKCSVDTQLDRAMLTIGAVDSVSREDFAQYAGLFGGVGVIEIVVSGILDRHTHVDLDLNDPMFTGKRIVLLADGPLDLAFGNAKVTWNTDGPDLQFRSDGDTVLQWLGAQGHGKVAHMLETDGVTRPLSAALEVLPYVAGGVVAARAAMMSSARSVASIIPDAEPYASGVVPPLCALWTEGVHRMSDVLATFNNDRFLPDFTRTHRAQASPPGSLLSVAG